MFIGWIYVMDPRLMFPLNIKSNVFNYVYVRRHNRSGHGFYSVSGDVFLCDIRPMYRGVIILKNVTTIWKMLCNNRPKICILDVNIFFWMGGTVALRSVNKKNPESYSSAAISKTNQTSTGTPSNPRVIHRVIPWSQPIKHQLLCI